MKFLIWLFIFACGIEASHGQETDAEKNRSTTRRLNYGTRGVGNFVSKESILLNQGLAKYLRFVVHDGNLVHGGVINTTILAYHYVGGVPFLAWPKGPKSVDYLFGGVFYVAAEVRDERGDTIHIVSDNFRRFDVEVAPDRSHRWGFAALPGYFNEHSPNSLDWQIGGISEDVGVDGLPGTGDFGEGDGILQVQEDFNRNGRLDLSMINTVNWFAISHRKETWPVDWPIGSFPGDLRQPGDSSRSVRAGRWNGEFGAYVRADQESYFASDDRENDEFLYYPFTDSLSRLPWPHGRRGLGLTVEVRNYQWSARLAEDLFISIYDITNKGKDLNKAIVGMYIDPDLGGSLGGDDARFDNDDDITYGFSSGVSSRGLPIAYIGAAFLESPGLPSDGRDNDGDGRIDESQNNGIDDDGDWRRWTDSNGNGRWDNEDANHNGRLDPGEDVNGNGRLDIEPLNDDLGSDGLGPEFDDYTGPDPDGTEANGVPNVGEPNFEGTDNDESDQVGLTSFYLRDVDNSMANDDYYWRTEIFPGTYAVRPGYQRDIAWSYGSGFVKFAGTEKLHRYALALLFGNDQPDILRNKRTMQVIYDEDYNFAKPPRKPRLTAVGGDRKVILTWDDAAESSRDPIYGHDFEAYYIYKSTDPTFANLKTITDAFGNPLLFKPLAIFDLKNGLQGIHPVRIGSELGPENDLGVSYNMGTDSGLKHNFIDTDVDNGRTYYYAVVSVDRGYLPSFYPRWAERESLLTISPTECSAIIQTDLLGRAINTDVNTAVVVPTEPPAGWQPPRLSATGIEKLRGSGTGTVQIEVMNPYTVKPNTGYVVQFYDDSTHRRYGDNYTGQTNNVILFDEASGNAIASVFNPDSSERVNEFIADGLRIVLRNDTTRFDSAFWSAGGSNLLPVDKTVENNGIRLPREYEIRVQQLGADTAVNGQATNFQIWDVTNPSAAFKLRFRYSNAQEPPALRGVLSNNDRVLLVSQFSTTTRLWILDFLFPARLDSSLWRLPSAGDVLRVHTRKAFDRNDAFRFTMTGNDIAAKKAKSDLDNIYTVPDPYIGASSLERKVINEEEGRGDRRIDFVNLPRSCTIKIFTTSGRFVRELRHESQTHLSRTPWDLRTKDGLEVASGIYFYVVEAPGIGSKTGRLAIVK